MEISGKLTTKLPIETGQGKNGTWKKQPFVIETEGQYPKKVALAIWGDKVNMDNIAIGSKLDIGFDIESREYNGRWYTEAKAFKINVSGAARTVQPASGGADNHGLPF